jgi:hypothetical protein
VPASVEEQAEEQAKRQLRTVAVGARGRGHPPPGKGATVGGVIAVRDAVSPAVGVEVRRTQTDFAEVVAQLKQVVCVRPRCRRTG